MDTYDAIERKAISLSEAIQGSDHAKARDAAVALRDQIGTAIREAGNPMPASDRLRRQARVEMIRSYVTRECHEALFTRVGRDLLTGAPGRIDSDKHADWKAAYDDLWGVDPALDNLSDALSA